MGRCDYPTSKIRVHSAQTGALSPIPYLVRVPPACLGGRDIVSRFDRNTGTQGFHLKQAYVSVLLIVVWVAQSRVLDALFHLPIEGLACLQVLEPVLSDKLGVSFRSSPVVVITSGGLGLSLTRELPLPSTTAVEINFLPFEGNVAFVLSFSVDLLRQQQHVL